MHLKSKNKNDIVFVHDDRIFEIKMSLAYQNTRYDKKYRTSFSFKVDFIYSEKKCD